MTDKENEMKELLVDYDVKKIKEGDIIKGKVIDVEENQITVNIDYAFDGVITKEELTREDVSPLDLVKKDDEFDVYVISPNDGEGYVVLSRVKALEITEKVELENAFNNKEIITVKIKELVKGGMVGYYGSTRVFIPGSQASRDRIELETLVGKPLEVKIIELDFRDRKLVASRRVIEMEQYNKERKAIWATIEPGQKKSGVVKGIAKFGAFVDIGGVEGLIHITDLAWERVNRVEDIVKVGDEVEVFVGTVDVEKQRLSLILKDRNMEPWKVHGDTIKEGDIFDGKIVRLVSFGAFVQILPGIEGLVHISQITEERIAKPEDVLKEGQSVKVKVLNIDKENKKLSLSIKDVVESSSEYLKYNDNDNEVGTSLGDLFKDFKF
ncbi:30S ribosomal protein S1 [Clostridium vincentii]|uniref:30S ribosomal protein S1 n=1 Tax=Clostridium vincentii TaxID=52704 RepID=A0A2T0BEX0_9CLOT|nr:30S ribosomal protein S1 [Clostridium vincentii]PRR82450.1 30S ribosomal protein S1 [Clostridium vincentii]